MHLEGRKVALGVTVSAVPMAATRLGNCSPQRRSSCDGAPAPQPLLLLCWAPQPSPAQGHVPRSSARSCAGAAESGPGSAAAAPRPVGGPASLPPEQGRRPGPAVPGQSRTRGLELPRHRHKHCLSSASGRHGQTYRAAEQRQSPAPSPRAAGPSSPRPNRSTHSTNPPRAPPPRMPGSYLPTMAAARNSCGYPLTAPLKPPQPPPSCSAGQPQPRCSRFWEKALICQTLWDFE